MLAYADADADADDDADADVAAAAAVATIPWIIRFVTSGHSAAIRRIRRPTQKTPWLALTSCRSPCSAPRNWLIRDQSHNAMACHPMRRLIPFTCH